MYSGAFKSRRVNASIAVGSAFFGMRTTVIVAAMLVEQLEAVSSTDYDRQSDVAAAHARWVRLRIRRASFLVAATLPSHSWTDEH
jgi:hypothetical protein